MAGRARGRCQNRPMRPWRKAARTALSLVAGASRSPLAAAPCTRLPARRAVDRRKSYDCKYNTSTSAFTGAGGTASAIGWEGNYEGVVTCLGGTFFVQDGINRDYGFGIYSGTPTTWTDAEGYLPAQITTFSP